MIGDRITDIIAGRKAGCKTILIQSGKHIDAPIETSMPIEGNIQPDAVFLDLSQAARFILAGEPD